MKLQLILTQKDTGSLAEAKQLSAIQQAQLTYSAQVYFSDKSMTLDKVYKGGEFFADLWQIVEVDKPEKVLYNFWEVNVDSGAVFYANSVKFTGVYQLQNYFMLDDDYKDNADAIALKEALTTAVKISLQSKEYVLNKEGEIIQFPTPGIIPNSTTGWNKLLKKAKIAETVIRQYHSFFDQACWDLVCASSLLSESFINEFSEKVNWKLVSRHQLLSEKFIRKHQHQMDWQAIAWAQKLSEAFILEFESRLKWDVICLYQELSEEFIRKNIEKFDQTCWNNLCKKQALTTTFIQEFPDKIQWNYVSQNLKLTDEQLRIFKDKINWGTLINYGRSMNELLLKEFENEFEYDEWEDILNLPTKFNLSQAFKDYIKKKTKKGKNVKKEIVEINDFKDEKLIPKDANGWKLFLQKNTVSESFIRKYHEHFSESLWFITVKKSKLSTDFIKEFEENISWIPFSYNKNITDEQLYLFQDKIDWWGIITFGRGLSEDLLKKYKEIIPAKAWKQVLSKQYKHKISDDFRKEIEKTLKS